jgi:hypothetical protein
MNRFTTALLAAVLLSPLCVAAGATTVVARSDDELALSADLVMVGRCTGAESRWVGRDLVTVATVEVHDRLKGDAPSAVTVVLPGGVDARRRVPVAVTWPGAPRIAVDEAVVLFLDAGAPVDGGYTITGFAQGKLSVVEDGAGVARVQKRGGRGETAGEPLDAFVARLRAVLDAGPPRR